MLELKRLLYLEMFKKETDEACFCMIYIILNIIIKKYSMCLESGTKYKVWLSWKNTINYCVEFLFYIYIYKGSQEMILR